MKTPICILTMHHCNPLKDAITIAPELFKEALIFIRELGYNFITYKEFKDVLFGRSKPLKNSVLLTFDDGYFDCYKFAFPILKELNIPAVCFLITDTITDYKRQNYDIEFKLHNQIDYTHDIEQFLNLDEIKEMTESGLFEFDSHTATHYSCKSNDLPILNDEFDTSYKKIKELFGKNSEFGFCWPKGHFNDTSMSLIKNSKYDFAFSVIDGGYCNGDDRFKIRRIDISNNARSKKDYLFRIKKKLKIYSTPILGDLYSKFRNRNFK
ncbi:polysaccharide deacetylase family protein [Campylobacter mucosalis]|uniref:Polysaccharide deacetylase n=1 Tax=Campylobacter mucosalis CCUG 21559 TaxID=1032067 RepID=A0A6G5QG66_9BACT|nr:polysaccharide deacetylase family protein [Campylobacter mucosalis]KEA45599.1 hypothetical protein CR66_06360 [Campylobacter mucosalis]QCD44496.1 polysaccharide deacetylase [Campylobacter mucosalis CCUG 21559]QKF62462.1 polysaccharide deacetylase [Campylobacter mucosalis]